MPWTWNAFYWIVCHKKLKKALFVLSSVAVWTEAARLWPCRSSIYQIPWGNLSCTIRAITENLIRQVKIKKITSSLKAASRATLGAILPDAAEEQAKRHRHIVHDQNQVFVFEATAITGQRRTNKSTFIDYTSSALPNHFNESQHRSTSMRHWQKKKKKKSQRRWWLLFDGKSMFLQTFPKISLQRESAQTDSDPLWHSRQERWLRRLITQRNAS